MACGVILSVLATLKLSTNDRFLQASCSVESETLPLISLCSIILKLLFQIALRMALLPVYDLEYNELSIWKIGSLSYANHPNVYTEPYTSSAKSHGLF